MSYSVDISKGKDPIPASSDLRNDATLFRVENKTYIFYGRLPFTLVNHKKRLCADKELVIKHGRPEQP